MLNKEEPDKIVSAPGRLKARKPEDFQRDFNLTIYAVGPNVATALESLGAQLGWGDLTGLEFQEDSNHAPCHWYVRFKADGTSMKAAGEFVTGGVIVTWWK